MAAIVSARLQPSQKIASTDHTVVPNNPHSSLDKNKQLFLPTEKCRTCPNKNHCFMANKIDRKIATLSQTSKRLPFGNPLPYNLPTKKSDNSIEN